MQCRNKKLRPVIGRHLDTTAIILSLGIGSHLYNNFVLCGSIFFRSCTKWIVFTSTFMLTYVALSSSRYTNYQLNHMTWNFWSLKLQRVFATNNYNVNFLQLLVLSIDIHVYNKLVYQLRIFVYTWHPWGHSQNVGHRKWPRLLLNAAIISVHLTLLVIWKQQTVEWI